LETRAPIVTAAVLKRKWLSEKTFEIRLNRPAVFQFRPGQRVSLSSEGNERDYSIVSAPEESELAFCIRNVAGGKLSSSLSTVEIGTSLSIKGPFGYFTYKPSVRQAVFVATGTGIAPFCSMAGSGISGFILVHGARLAQDLYYASLFRQTAEKYIPCLSEANKLPAGAIRGQVTDYLQRDLKPEAYDFYLCGRSDMIRDITLLIDERFPDSLVYTESFY
jgi:benzoate/toluate 1,2-dioxygenase reductase component